MATDSTHLLPGDTSIETDTDMSAGSSDLGSVQLAAATGDASISVNIPGGQKVVVVPVKPGQTIELPTDSVNGLLAKLGADGNLAIVVDGRTIILKGYAEANAESPIKIVTNDGDLVDVAEVIVATNPDIAIDIQTAAGPAAAGAQAGTDGAGSGIFVPFAAGALLGGFDAAGVLGATQLAYKNIDDDRVLFTREEAGNNLPQDIKIVPDEGQPTIEGGAFLLDEDFLKQGNHDLPSPPPSPGDDAGSNIASGTVVVDFGGDGPAATNPIQMSAILPGTLSGLFALSAGADPTQPGTEIQLFLDPPAGGFQVLHGFANGIEYFTLTLDTSTGHFEVEQLQPLWHPNELNTEDNVALDIEFTATDSNGDHLEATLNLSFDDDMPAITLQEAEFSLAVDETVSGSKLDFNDPNFPDDGVQDGSRAEGDENLVPLPTELTSIGTVIGAAQADGSALFAVSFGADGGAKNQDALTYSLNIQDANTGLFDTETGKEITLVDVGGGVIEGQIPGGTEVFAFFIDSATGEVSMAQYRAIDHGDEEAAPGAVDEVLFLGTGHLSVTVTAIDGDGDQASQSADIGNAISFDDDGPRFICVDFGNDEDGDRIDEDALPVVGLGDSAPGDDSGGTFTDGVINFKFGSDKPGSLSIGSLTVKDSAGNTIDLSNLHTSDGRDLKITETVDAGTGVITFAAVVADGEQGAGDPVFTFKLDSSGAGVGEFSFELFQALEHPYTDDDFKNDGPDTTYEDNLIFDFTVVGKDGDGDQATGHITINVDDDSPVTHQADKVVPTAVLDESPVGEDEDGDNDPAGLKSVTVDFSGNFVSDFGADGPGDNGGIGYALKLTGDDVPSGLYALDPNDTTDGDGDGIGQGDEILLNQSGDKITGSVNGTDYFTIEVDPDTGKVTFTQTNNIWHGDTANDDDTETLTLEKSSDLQLVQTVTDADGDSASSAISLGGGVFQIEDDGPDASVKDATADPIVLDESPIGEDEDGDFDPAGLKTVTVDLSLNFNAPDFGTDGKGNVDYALKLTGKDVGSGLYALDPTDTTDGDGDGIGQGDEILLNQSGDKITGSANGTDYFTIEVDPDTGKVTFTQTSNIWHGDTANDDDTGTLTLDEASDLQLVQTVTDADGDSESAAIDLGTGVFQIEDDGPDASVKDATADPIVLDESPIGKDEDGDFDPAGLKTVTVDLSQNFNAPDYGTDGPGDVDYSLKLTGKDVGSGLYALDPTDTTDGDGDGIGQGDEILLNQSGDKITGSANGTDYFTIEVDPDTGKVTFTQTNNIWHDDTSNDDDSETLTLDKASDLQLVQTVTDADGDSESAAINLGTGVFQIEDDGPDASVKDGTVDPIVLDESPVGEDEDGDFDPAGLKTVTVDLSLNFNAPDFGTDGKGDVDYSLKLTGKDVGSGLYALDPTDTTDGDGDGIGQGDEILLNQSGDKITGSANGTDYFTIEVDPDTGKVTFTQTNNIWHENTGSDDDTQTLTLDKAADLQLVQTVTDADGDSEGAAISLGAGVFQIEDDGPDASVSTRIPLPTVVLDESPIGEDEDGDFDPAGLKTVTVDFSLNFNAPDFGTDGPGDVDYSLKLTGKDVGSGLYALDPTDTTDGDGDGIGQGDEILLNQSGDKITGSANGTDYFTIEVDPDTGKVTFTQTNNIWHENTGSDDDTQTLTLEKSSDLQLVQSVVDADGDSESAAINLGAGVFQIEDDGPDASVKDATADPIVLDESPTGKDEGGDFDPPGLSTVTVDLSLNFNAPDFGTDGEGDVDYSLKLNGKGVPSGLYALDATDTTDGDGDGIGQGDEILLVQSGDKITGSANGTDYFTIEVDADAGKVTFTQLDNIWHSDTGSDDDSETLTLAKSTDLQLVQTVTDADGDKDTASISLGTGVFQIEDDGPNSVVSNSVAAVIVLDETRPVGTEEDGDSNPAGLATAKVNYALNFAAPDYGSDGAGSVGYTLVLTGVNVLSGLYALDAADGKDVGGDGDGIGRGSQILLNQAGNLITGSVGGTDYFTIGINTATGEVTFTQLNNIWHGNTGSDDDTSTLTLSNANLLQLVQTVIDADGDKDTSSINLGTGVFQIEDDGPNSIVSNSVAAAIVLDETRPVGTEEDGDSNPAGVATAKVNYSLNFAAPDYGSDGAGSVSYALALTGVNVASGLYALDAADGKDVGGDGDGIGQGAQILLNQAGNLITGSVGGTDYFTISINTATGEVTFTQLNNIWHANTGSDDDTATLNLLTANLLQLVQTVIDADGDKDTSSIDLGQGVFQIEDDGPNSAVATTPPLTLVLDETRPVGTEEDGDSNPAGLDTVKANFALSFLAPDFGSDGAGSVGYALTLTGVNVASGLYALDAADGKDVGGDGDGIGQGAQILLNQAGNLITGSVGGTDYFTISINTATGEVTFTQLNNIWHANTGSDDDTATLTLSNANLLQLVQTVIDADGDKDTSSINLGTGVFQIEDDGPNSVVSNAAAAAIVLDETRPVGTETDGDSSPAGLDTAKVNYSLNFAAPDYGSDGAGSVGYTLVLTGTDVPSGLYALDATDGKDVGGDGDGIGQGAQILLNQTGNVITGSAGGTDYFTITINTATGEVTFTQLNNIWHANTGSDDDTMTLTLANANLLQLVQTVIDADGDKDTSSINLGTGVFQIEDDGPTAVDDVKNAGTSGSVTGNVLTDGTDDSFGTDGKGTITKVVFDGTTYVDGDDGSVDGFINVKGDFGDLKLDTSTGAYTYTRTTSIFDLGQDVFTYTIQDADGDKDDATLTLNVDAANILNGVFITNTNVVDQPLILTFQQVTNPIHFSAKVYSLNAQGQQGTVTQDVGFYIDPTLAFMYAVEAGETTSFTNINVTDFSLEGTDLNAPGGSDNWAIRYDDDQDNGPGTRDLAYTGVFTPSTKTENETDQPSVDGDDKANSLTDPDAGGVGLDYQFGAAGNDTLNGDNTEADVLNGGNGIDQLLGNGGNDILVYDAADVALAATGKIDGGAGVDVLRIDDGALAIFFGTANNVVNLVGADITNIEVIGLTEEAVSDKNNGTTIKLSAADVIAFSGDALGVDTLYIVGNQGDKVQLASNGAGFVDGDGGTAGIQPTGTFDDGQGQVFNVFTLSGGGALYVDKDITVETVA